jgi:hypothetical protein
LFEDGLFEMDYLKSIQAIIELAQKRPVISFLCLGCLMVIIFSPLILALAPSHQIGRAQDNGKGSHGQTQSPSFPSQPQIPSLPNSGGNALSVIQPVSPNASENPSQGPIPVPAIGGNQPIWRPNPASIVPAQPTVSVVTPLPGSTATSVIAPNSNQRYFIVVASRADRESAISAANRYSDRFPAEVYQTPNGWYAITIGRYAKPEAQRILSQESLSQAIPQGAWLSPGKEWLGKVYP